MATIAENIQTLKSIKSDIKNAITDKGGNVGNDFKTYAQAITDLPSGGGTENEDGLITRTISVYSNDRVSVVGDYAFASCTNLSTVNLSKVKTLGFYAFAYCSALQSIDLPLCEFVNFNTFASCKKMLSVNLPNCYYVHSRGFYYCSALQSIDLPLCEHLGSYTFAFCSALSIVNIPLCTDIHNYGFDNCRNLIDVYLNSVSRVTTIQSITFSHCPNLTSIYVPASLVDAFKTAQYWSSISDKIVAYRDPSEPNKLVYSAKSAGSTITVNGETMTLEQGDNIELNYPNEITSVEAADNEALTYLQIPNTVTSINDNAFEFCIGLESVIIPSGVTSIRGTFNACSALTSVTLPDTLQTIGDSTFADCTSLASITIPSSVTMIESYAFDYCEALTDFNFNGTMEQWSSITLADDWKNNAAFTVVHCTDGDVNI